MTDIQAYYVLVVITYTSTCHHLQDVGQHANFTSSRLDIKYQHNTKHT